MYKYFFALCFLSISLFAQAAIPAPAPGGNDNREQKVIGGLKWTIGSSFVPELVLGYRNVLINTNDEVKGFSSEITYNFINKSIGDLKINGIYGNVDLTGELSFGYNFISDSFLTGIGAQSAYINGNIDYLFKDGFKYSVELNSIND